MGKNGSGKTNLLDAIYYLCMCKSYFTNSDLAVARHESNFFRLEGKFERHGEAETVVCKIQLRKQKVIERNKAAYKRLSEHIGHFPVVMIAPDDTMLAVGGSEERRRFLDNTLSQLDAIYLQHLIFYNKVLQQRNAALKRFAESGRFDQRLLNTYNQQLLGPAQYIHEARQAMIAALNPVFDNYYNLISNRSEQVSCCYTSKLEGANFASLLAESAEKDRILQRTTVGIHKDDLTFLLNDRPLKRFASQGQLKSFVLALKLAQYHRIREHQACTPILLLDDLFDKLDTHRIRGLLELLHDNTFGQVFITDTHEQRLEELLSGFSDIYKQFTVENGTLKDE